MPKNKNHKAKILLFDIETSLMELELRAFSLIGPKYLPYKSIKKDSYVICISWKWLGEDEVHALSILDFPDVFEIDPRNDSELLMAFADVFNEADIAVGHNGDNFDIKSLRTRYITKNLPDLKNIKTVDTLKQLRKIARFPSNRLDYIAPTLGFHGKLDTEGLWNEIADNGSNKKACNAILKMVDYNKNDILMLEYVYNWLLPYMKDHPHVGVIEGTKAKYSCSNCGSTNLAQWGYMHTKTKTYKRYKCKDCGHSNNKGEKARG